VRGDSCPRNRGTAKRIIVKIELNRVLIFRAQSISDRKNRNEDKLSMRY
jgi:hypothetical protein